VFTDRASGKDGQRPQLGVPLAFARGVDTMVVHAMDRWVQNLDDLRRILQGFTRRGVCIEFVATEHLHGAHGQCKRCDHRWRYAFRNVHSRRTMQPGSLLD
jgi:DNA invertase Pin-like site-specific DNA recombinase